MIYYAVIMEFDSYLEFITKLRRKFHTYPELGNFEYKTQKIIIKNFKNLKVPYKKVDTGLIAYLNFEKPKTIAFRADMDALPITEANNTLYKSKNEGVMHACGHDGHMAILLTFIKWAVENKDKITKNLKFIFQPAEESIGGAEKMISANALENVDEIYAVHLAPEIEGGVFGVKPGLSMAGVLEFNIEFFGKSCHVADYKNGADAIKASLNFLNFKLPAEFKNAVFHIGKIAGGYARNVVADYCKLECSFRFFENAYREKFINFLTAELEKFSKNGVDFKISPVAEYPPLINSEVCIEKVKKICNSVDTGLRLSAEDFSYYLKKCEGCLVWLGVKDSSSICNLHSNDFDFNEKYLLKGVELFAKLASLD